MVQLRVLVTLLESHGSVWEGSMVTFLQMLLTSSVTPSRPKHILAERFTLLCLLLVLGTFPFKIFILAWIKFGRSFVFTILLLFLHFFSVKNYKSLCYVLIDYKLHNMTRFPILPLIYSFGLCLSLVWLNVCQSHLSF